MDPFQPLFLVLILSGILYFLAGWILFKYPPKNINWWYGYRTSGSMKSQERWDFSQTYAGKELMKIASLLILLSLPGWYISHSIHEGMGTTIGIGIMIISALIPVFKTEKALNQKFGKN